MGEDGIMREMGDRLVINTGTREKPFYVDISEGKSPGDTYVDNRL